MYNRKLFYFLFTTGEITTPDTINAKCQNYLWVYAYELYVILKDPFLKAGYDTSVCADLFLVVTTYISAPLYFIYIPWYYFTHIKSTNRKSFILAAVLSFTVLALVLAVISAVALLFTSSSDGDSVQGDGSERSGADSQQQKKAGLEKCAKSAPLLRQEEKRDAEPGGSDKKKK